MILLWVFIRFILAIGCHEYLHKNCFERGYAMYAKELRELMDEWRIQPKHVDHLFNYDGIVNEEAWNAETNKKILFFLKEAYHDEAGEARYKEQNNAYYFLTEELDSCKPWKMWRKVAVWTAAINNTDNNGTLKYSETDIRNAERDLIKSIAVVNIKKSDGNNTSEHENLRTYADEDKGYIKREIELIKPKIILCGNNCSLLEIVYPEMDLDELHEDHSVIFNGTIILDYYHPANQYPNFVNYYAVAGIYQQALKKLKNIS